MYNPVYNLVAGVGVEPTYEAYETSDWAASLTRNKLGPGSCLPCNCSTTELYRHTNELDPRRGLEPRSPDYETGTSPSTPAGNTLEPRPRV